ncbi:MAG: hypothetical protein LKF31_10370 [Muribaculaceae bacterium]|jgi:hypothetical protein|nr:hypothetical protein [Muribaculaceae bacterium]
MKDPIVLTPKTLRRMAEMQVSDQKAIISAFFTDEILGIEREVKLTTYQELSYLMLRDMIKRDSRQFLKREEADKMTYERK